MGSVRIVAPRGRKLADDFNLVGRRTAEFLADLLPGIDVMLSYTDSSTADRQEKPLNGMFASWSSSVREDPRLNCTTTLSMSDKSLKFIGERFEGISTKIFDVKETIHKDHSMRGGLNLKYVHFTAMGLLPIGDLVGPESPKIVSEWLSNQIPLFYVAEFLAGIWYPQVVAVH